MVGRFTPSPGGDPEPEAPLGWVPLGQSCVFPLFPAAFWEGRQVEGGLAPLRKNVSGADFCSFSARDKMT